MRHPSMPIGAPSNGEEAGAGEAAPQEEHVHAVEEAAAP
jgi:hypothetical protein